MARSLSRKRPTAVSHPLRSIAPDPLCSRVLPLVAIPIHGLELMSGVIDADKDVEEVTEMFADLAKKVRLPFPTPRRDEY
jgi:hypothetical protein